MKLDSTLQQKQNWGSALFRTAIILVNDYYARTICCLFYSVGEIGWSLIQFTVANLYIVKLVRTFSRKCVSCRGTYTALPGISSPSLLLHLLKGSEDKGHCRTWEGMGVGAGTEHSFQHLCSKKGPLLATAAPIPYPRTFSALSLWRDFLFFSFFFFWERVLLHSRGWPWDTEISCLPSARVKCLCLHLWHYQGFLNWQHG